MVATVKNNCQVPPTSHTGFQVEWTLFSIDKQDLKSAQKLHSMQSNSWCKIVVHCNSSLTHLQFSWLENTFDKMWSNLSYLPICSIFNHIYHPFSLQKFIIQMSLTWKIKYKKNVIEGATCLSCLLKRRVKAPPISQRKTFLLYKSLAFLRCLVGTKKFDLLFLWPSKSYKKWKDATCCLKIASKVSPT